MNVEAVQKNIYKLEMVRRLQHIYALAKVLEEIYYVSEEKGIDIDEILIEIFYGQKYKDFRQKIYHTRNILKSGFGSIKT